MKIDQFEILRKSNFSLDNSTYMGKYIYCHDCKVKYAARDQSAVF